MVNLALTLLAAAGAANAYWLMGMTDTITTVRIDPIVNPNALSGHAHTVVGGSGFRRTSSTAQLRNSKCTSTPIKEDKSNYWFPTLYFQWANGSFTSVDAGVVIYYLFDNKPGKTTAFPDDFRMLSGDPFLRTYDANSHAQQAITFLCLDFNGVTTKHDRLPNKFCPSGIRAQINFPSCWDGKRTDSANHKDHVAFRSGGPDSGSCTDPNYPIELPRIFLEAYMNTGPFDKVRGQAANPGQPFVYSHGDATGFGFHGDFFNGWMPGVLQKAVDGCNCNIYGDPQCCANKGIFTLDTKTHCKITSEVDEVVTGTIPKLPGYNPIQPEGRRAVPQVNPNPATPPAFLSPVYEYTGNSPPGQGTPVVGNPPANTPAPSPNPVTPPVSNPSPTPSNPPSPPVVNPPAGSPTKSGSTSPSPTGKPPGHGHGTCNSGKKRGVRISRNFESYDF